MKLDDFDLEAQYAKARIAFGECAANDPRVFLDDLGVAWDSLRTKDESVRITFDGSNGQSYLLESKLLLLSQNDEPVGWYCLHEDENGDVVDDFLVFD